MIILLDMDGPLAHFDQHAWNKCAELGIIPDIETIEHQTSRWLTDHMTRDDEAELRAVINEPGWFRELPVVDGAQAGVDQLVAAGHEVYVCTKPLETNPTCRDEKAAWLREHFPYLEDRLFIAPDKSLVWGDILLDDAPKPKWFHRSQWNPVIYDCPYNGAGSVWAKLPRWTWGQPIGELTCPMT